MRGDQPDLAHMQIQITKDVLAQTTAKKVIMCPTYYSFAPKLEKVFGIMPKNYFQDLGEGLPPEVDIFWTGPEICSQEYPESHMEEVNKVTTVFNGEELIGCCRAVQLKDSLDEQQVSQAD